MFSEASSGSERIKWVDRISSVIKVLPREVDAKEVSALIPFVGEETAQSMIAEPLALSLVGFVNANLALKSADFVAKMSKSSDLGELRCGIASKDPKTKKLSAEEAVMGGEAALDIYNAVHCNGQEIQVMGNCVLLLTPWPSVKK